MTPEEKLAQIKGEKIGWNQSLYALRQSMLNTASAMPTIKYSPNEVIELIDVIKLDWSTMNYHSQNPHEPTKDEAESQAVYDRMREIERQEIRDKPKRDRQRLRRRLLIIPSPINQIRT